MKCSKFYRADYFSINVLKILLKLFYVQTQIINSKPSKNGYCLIYIKYWQKRDEKKSKKKVKSIADNRTEEEKHKKIQEKAKGVKDSK